MAGIAPSFQAAARDSKVAEVNGVAVATDGGAGELAGFNNGALGGHVGELERCSEGVSVLVELDSVVSVGSVVRDGVGGLGDCDQGSKGAEERYFELHGCDLSIRSGIVKVRGEIYDSG